MEDLDFSKSGGPWKPAAPARAINRNVFLNLVKSDPTFGISLLSAMAERVRRNTAAGIG